jgi:hypothetical protein
MFIVRADWKGILAYIAGFTTESGLACCDRKT